MRNKVAVIIILTFVFFMNIYAKGVNKAVVNREDNLMNNSTISKTSQIFTYANGERLNSSNQDLTPNLISEQNVKFIMKKMN